MLTFLLPLRRCQRLTNCKEQNASYKPVVSHSHLPSSSAAPDKPVKLLQAEQSPAELIFTKDMENPPKYLPFADTQQGKAATSKKHVGLASTVLKTSGSPNQDYMEAGVRYDTLISANPPPYWA